jgi:hypothetical protein
MIPPFACLFIETFFDVFRTRNPLFDGPRTNPTTKWGSIKVLRVKNFPPSKLFDLKKVDLVDIVDSI